MDDETALAPVLTVVTTSSSPVTVIDFTPLDEDEEEALRKDHDVNERTPLLKQ